MTDKMEERIDAVLLKRIANLMMIGIGSVVLGSFGVGTFFASTRTSIQNIEAELSDFKMLITQDIQVRLRLAEQAIASGVLPVANEKLRDMEARVRKLEIKVGASKAKQVTPP